MKIDTRILHKKFAALGRQRNKLTYELLAMLPQVYSEKIFIKYKCATIYEYAGKYAGLSRTLVDKALKLNRSLQDKPHLKELIKEEGVHKVALVAKLATPRTDKVLAERVSEMSMAGVRELSKELRQKVDVESAILDSESNGDNGKCLAAQKSLSIQLDSDMQCLFFKLKKMVDKKSGVNLSNKQALKKMLEMLDTNENSHAQKIIKTRLKGGVVKNFNVEKMDKHLKTLNNTNEKEHKGTMGASRYIPVTVRRDAVKATNGKCVYPGCNKPYDQLHHKERFAKSKCHNSIVPMCKVHHEFAHSGIIANERLNQNKWQLDIYARSKSKIDDEYRKHHKKVKDG